MERNGVRPVGVPRQPARSPDSVKLDGLNLLDNAHFFPLQVDYVHKSTRADDSQAQEYQRGESLHE